MKTHPSNLNPKTLNRKHITLHPYNLRISYMNPKRCLCRFQWWKTHIELALSSPSPHHLASNMSILPCACMIEMPISELSTTKLLTNSSSIHTFVVSCRHASWRHIVLQDKTASNNLESCIQKSLSKPQSMNFSKSYMIPFV